MEAILCDLWPSPLRPSAGWVIPEVAYLKEEGLVIQEGLESFTHPDQIEMVYIGHKSLPIIIGP